MNAPVHPAAVERAMSAAMSLIASLGDDAEDEILKMDVLQGETDALEIVRKLIRVALEAEAMVEAVEARTADLNVRAARFAAQAERARNTARDMLEALEVKRLVSEDFTVSLKALPPKVIAPEPEKLADEFVRVVTTRTADKPLIKAAIDAGRTVEHATLSNGGVSIQIRTR
jgi:hypothetical protein